MSLPTLVEIQALFPQLDSLHDERLREQVIATWADAATQCETRHKITEVPFLVAAPDETVVQHTNLVTRAALQLASLLPERSMEVDQDVLIASCLLHDVDKVLLYTRDGGGTWNHANPLIQHGVLGAMLCREHGLPEEIVHIVLTHTIDSPLPPQLIEGVVLHYADLFAADSALYRNNLPLLLR